MAKEALGWASATGVFAGLLAENGFMELPDIQEIVPDSMAQVWPATVFDGAEGEGLEFVMTLGSVWEVNNVYFKPYPSCRYTHATLDAISDLMASQRIQYRDVERIVVRTHRRGAWLDNRRPRSMEHAQYSLPYVVALLLVFGSVHPSGFAPKALADPIVLTLADRVEVIHDPALDAYYPGQYPSSIEVTLRDGSTVRDERFTISGDPDCPLAPERRSAKFEGLVSPLRGVAACDELLRLLGASEDHELWELEQLLFL
jgi:2-methylcitrate dehydratase PrpD